MDRHYHIATASRDGMIISEAKYTDRQASINDFIGMSRAIYNNNKISMSLTEMALINYAADESKEACIYIDVDSPLRIYWIVCSKCRSLAINN